MSVIPFEPGAISAFYEQTMAAYKLNNMGTIHKGVLEMDFNRGKQRCQELYGALLKVFQSKDSITTVKYADNISNLPLKIQHVAFVLRAELVYQLLLVVNLTLADSLNHAQVYNAAFHPDLAFRADVAPELANYQLGIFGSSNPTSDIDIGVRYAGQGNLVALAHVVRVMEDAYVTHLNITSLDLDVETYGNTETVQVHGKEVFFMNTAEFEENDFKEVLPYAWASILRNMATAKNINVDKCKEVDTACLRTLIDDVLAIQSADILKASFVSELETIGMQNDLALIQQADVFTAAKLLVLKYIKLNYEEARAEYYKYIFNSETNLMDEVKPVLESGAKLDNAQIVKALKLSAMALIYRKESYTLAPTIAHVVRIIQGKTKETIADCLRDKSFPVCSLGKYGYLLSALEQIGYMSRVKITYCAKASHKCPAKMKKYMDRYKAAMKGLKVTASKGSRFGGTRKRRLSKRFRKTTRLRAFKSIEWSARPYHLNNTNCRRARRKRPL